MKLICNHAHKCPEKDCMHHVAHESLVYCSGDCQDETRCATRGIVCRCIKAKESDADRS